MCGSSSRTSSGGRIAIMFPSASPLHHHHTLNPYSLFFHDDSHHTTAIFRIEDPQTQAAFYACESIDLRIDRHGDLTSTSTSTSTETESPLHCFRLCWPGCSGSGESGGEMVFELPERLDLGVSEKGIVGRRVRVVIRGRRKMEMGVGVVGYD